LSEKLKSLWNSIRNILSLAIKPTKEEFNLMFKIVGVGFLIVGTYTFVISLLGFGLQSINISSVPQIAILIFTVVIGIVLLLYYYGTRKRIW
jgi:protein translocase SEC61 complex gamma subunit, archaeal and eukaryotic